MTHLNYELERGIEGNLVNYPPLKKSNWRDGH